MELVMIFVDMPRVYGRLYPELQRRALSGLQFSIMVGVLALCESIHSVAISQFGESIQPNHEKPFATVLGMYIPARA